MRAREEASAAETRPAVSLRALERARSTLEDFAKSYYMFHGFATPADLLFAHLPILVFVEGCIYQADEENEDATQALAAGSSASHRAPSLALLEAALERRGLIDDQLRRELRCGAEYWAIERELCGAWAAADEGAAPKRPRREAEPEPPPPPEAEAPEEVYEGIDPPARAALSRAIHAIHLKSFDYRVLNLLLYRSANRPADAAALDFLSTSELLVEIGDDLLDYEDDVVRNSFNLLRAFVRAHGRAAPLRLLELTRFHEQRYAEKLARLSDRERGLCEARCREAMQESGPGRFSGRWSVPPLILDEAAYRSEFGDEGD